MAILDVDERDLNPHGVVHGGVVFTLVDTAMGQATMGAVEDGMRCATIELSVRYLRPITGGRLVATASVLKARRRVMHLEGTVIVEGDGRPVAVVQESFAVMEA